MKSERRIKILMAFSFILIFLALFIINKSPATGYERSIYTSTPLVWILLVGAIACGVIIATNQVFSKEKRKDWIIGFLIVLLSIFIIVSMHALRGYYMYGSGDAPAHLNMAKQIVSSGYVSERNFYPITHILISEIVEITNVSPLMIGRYLPGLFTVFYMFSIYLLSNIVLPRREHKILATFAGGTLFFSYYHVMLYPQILSALFLPFIFYFYFRNEKSPSTNNKVPLIILLFLLTFFHPLSMVMLISFLLTMEFAKPICNKLRSKNIQLNQINLRLTLISIIAFITWISSLFLFGMAIRGIFSTIGGETSYQLPQIENATEGIKVLDLISLSLKRYGDNAVYGLLSLIGGGIAIKRIGNGISGLEATFRLFIWFLVSGTLLFVLFLGVHQIYLNRVLDSYYALLVSPLLGGFVLFELFKRYKYRMIFVSTILISVIIISIFGVYNSPWTLQPSWQTTYHDVRGVVWLSKHNAPITVEGLGFDSGDGAVASIEYNLGDLKLLRPNYINPQRTLPEKFNYSLYNEIGSIFSQDRYLVTEIRAEMAADDPTLLRTKLDPTIPWGKGEDFYRLGNDESVNKIYSNNEVKIWYIKTRGGVK